MNRKMWSRFNINDGFMLYSPDVCISQASFMALALIVLEKKTYRQKVTKVYANANTANTNDNTRKAILSPLLFAGETNNKLLYFTTIIILVVQIFRISWNIMISLFPYYTYFW